mmetsp:Transcript_1774/g.3974  ORF Transcript_1774/g.3974 Transcript_1774/m.3974 type:complete len:822 (+) Transcript_1774:101-2566(+)
MGLTEGYINFLERRAKWVLLSVFVVIAVAAPFALQLSKAAVDSFPPSAGTRSAEENKIFQDLFPSVFDDSETIFAQCKGVATECSCDANSCTGFRKVMDALTNGLSPYKQDGTIRSIESILDILENPQLKPLAGQYYNESAKAFLVKLTLDSTKDSKQAKAAVAKATEVVEDLDESSHFNVEINGRLADGQRAEEAIGKAIGMADGIGIIVIIILFGWRTGSWRLTLIPAINTGCCLFLAEALCLPLVKSGAIILPSFVPNVCLFLCIALSVDYSFFHLSRYQELRKMQNELKDAVLGMVLSAGRVVLVSGAILVVTWLALGAFPVFGVDALGFCASITIFSCILVNMIMNPAMILAFPKFFAKAAQDPCRRCQRRRSNDQQDDEPPLNSPPEDPLEVTKNMYGRIAKHVTKMPGMLIVPLLVYAIFLPVAVVLFKANLSVGGVQGGTDEGKEISKDIGAAFPSQGSSGGAPLLLVLEAPATAEGVKSQAFFDMACTLAQEVQAQTKLPVDSFRGPMITTPKPGASQVQCMSWPEAEQALAHSAIFKHYWDQSVSADGRSALLTALPPFDTFSDKAKGLINDARKAIDTFRSGAPTYTSACYNPMGVEVDAEAVTFRRFPIVISLTVFAVFGAIGIRYRAALVPVKLLFTIALPILFVLGSGVLVFQNGWLNWTHIPSLQSQGGLVWINPVACSFMLLGFALDYDIFLFSRIYEERKKGRFLEDRSAIVYSVAATGPVITTAGIIMALAFSGMVVQHDNPFLCQMGFTMILGVLVDTFVVRTLLVPALLQAAGRLNWWPGKMPTATSPHVEQRQIFLDSSA